MDTLKNIAVTKIFLMLLFMQILWGVPFSATLANDAPNGLTDPVSNAGIRRYATSVPTDPSGFDVNTEGAFFTCGENGWVLADHWMGLNYKQDEPWSDVEFGLIIYGVTLAAQAVMILACLPFLAIPFIGGIFYAICVATTTYYLVALAIIIGGIIKNEIESYGLKYPLYAESKFTDTSREVIKGIRATFTAEVIKEPLNIEDMDSFVGVLMNLAQTALDGLQRPVSNSAHALCHVIRCARDLTDGFSDGQVYDKSMAILSELEKSNPDFSMVNGGWILRSGSNPNPVYDNNTYRSCRVFADMMQDRMDSKYIQDLKNYLSLSYLNHMKQVAKKQLQPAPFMSLSQYRGVSDKMIDSVNSGTVDQLNMNFFNKVFLNDARDAKLGTILGRRMKNLCSKIEAEWCLPVILRFDNIQYNPSSQQFETVAVDYNVTVPRDMMGSSLYDTPRFANTDQTFRAVEALSNVMGINHFPIKEADKIFVRDPDDPNDVSSSAFKKDGEKHLYAKYRSTAHLSVAQLTLQEALMKRMPWQTNSDPNRSLIPTSSQLENLEQEAKRRLYDDQWYQMINLAGDTTILKDVISMMVLQLKMKYEMSENLERLEALMAANMSLQFDFTTLESIRAEVEQQKATR